MSSLIPYLNDKQFVIATDTVAHTKNETASTFLNFCTKTYYLPHLKCCFACQGVLELANQYYLFAQNHVIANDLSSLAAQTKRHFKAKIDLLHRSEI